MPFIDGDDLHDASSIAKISAGVPLTDEDRTPWLQAIRQRAFDVTSAAKRSGEAGVCVVACSALRRSYRNILRGLDATSIKSHQLLACFIYLQVSEAELHKRMRLRASHFMKETMLRSQLDTLEEPGSDEVEAVTLRNEDSPSLATGAALPPRELSISDNPALQGCADAEGAHAAKQTLAAQWTIQLAPGTMAGTAALGLPQTGAAAHPCAPPPPPGEENKTLPKQAFLSTLAAAVGHMRDELDGEFTRAGDERGAWDAGAPSMSRQTGSGRQDAAANEDGDEGAGSQS